MGVDIWETYGYVPASTSGTTITSSATANTMGAWTQIGQVNAPAGIDLIEVNCGNMSQNANMLVDIGIGPSGSQVVRIPSLILFNYGTGARQVVRFPLFFPPGALIWARCQSTVTSATTVDVAAKGRYRSNRHSYCQSIVAYGVNASSSSGTSLSLGNNAFNSTSFGNSTVLHKRFVAIWIGGNGAYAVQLLVGSFIAIDTTIMIQPGGLNFLVFPTSVESGDIIVPGGTPLAMNCSSNASGSSDSFVTCVLYGLT